MNYINGRSNVSSCTTLTKHNIIMGEIIGFETAAQTLDLLLEIIYQNNQVIQLLIGNATGNLTEIEANAISAVVERNDDIAPRIRKLQADIKASLLECTSKASFNIPPAPSSPNPSSIVNEAKKDAFGVKKSLLDEIRRGKNLKQQAPNAKGKQEESTGLFSALKQRRVAIQPDEDDEDNDDWEEYYSSFVGQHCVMCLNNPPIYKCSGCNIATYCSNKCASGYWLF